MIGRLKGIQPVQEKNSKAAEKCISRCVVVLILVLISL